MPILPIFDPAGELMPDAEARVLQIMRMPPGDLDHTDLSPAAIKSGLGRAGMVALRQGHAAGELLMVIYAHHIEQRPASLNRAVKFIAARRRGTTNRFGHVSAELDPQS